MTQNRIRRTPPCSRWDLEAMESWLTDLADQGWLLTEDNALRGRLVFREGSSDHTAYRLIPCQTWGDDAPNGFFQEDMRKLGWLFVRRWEEFYIFLSFDPAPKEPYSSPESMIADLELVKKRQWWTIAIGIGLIAVAIGALIWGSATTLLIQMATGILSWLFPLMALLCFTLYFIQPIRAIRHLDSLQKNLRSGTPPDRRKNWKAGAPGVWLADAAQTGIWILFLFSTLTLNFGDEPARRPLTEFPGQPPFVMLVDVTDNVRRDRGYYQLHGGTLFPVIIQWTEHGAVVDADGSDAFGFLDLQYVEAPNEWLATAMAKDLTSAHSRGGKAQLLPQFGLDYAAGTNKNGLIRVILAEGNQVVCARFTMGKASADFDLEHWTELMVKKLKMTD